jgi:hypothetical protein
MGIIGFSAIVLMMFAVRAHAAIQYVIVVIIDGGRGDFIQTFIETAPSEFPELYQLYATA